MIGKIIATISDMLESKYSYIFTGILLFVGSLGTLGCPPDPDYLEKQQSDAYEKLKYSTIEYDGVYIRHTNESYTLMYIYDTNTNLCFATLQYSEVALVVVDCNTIKKVMTIMTK